MPPNPMREAAKLKRRSWSGVSRAPSLDRATPPSHEWHDMVPSMVRVRSNSSLASSSQACEISVDTTWDGPRSHASQGRADSSGGGRRWAPNIRLLPTVIKIVLVMLLLELSRSTLVATGSKGAQDPNLLSRALKGMNGDPPGLPLPAAKQQPPSPATFSRFAALRQATRVSLSSFTARLRSQHPLRPLRLTVFKGGRGLSLLEQQQQLRAQRRRGKPVPLALGRGGAGVQASSSEGGRTGAVAAAGVIGIGGGGSVGQLEDRTLLEWQSQLLAEEEALLQEEERDRQLGLKSEERHSTLAKLPEERGGSGGDVIADCQARGDCGKDVGELVDDGDDDQDYDTDDDKADYSEGAGVDNAATGNRAAANNIVGDTHHSSGSHSSTISSSSSTSSSLPAGSAAGGATAGRATGSPGSIRSTDNGGGGAQGRSYPHKRWLSFSVCNGITSQRIAVLSAALLARETQRVLLITRLLINGTEVRGQQSNDHNAASCDFSEVMDPRHFAQALATEGVVVEMPALSVPAPSVRLDLSRGDALGQLEAKDQQVHVHVSCPFLRVPPALFIRHEPLVWAALRGMQPSQKLLDAADAAAERFMQVTGQQAFNVLHLRPMSDWEERCGQAMFGNQPCPFDLAIAGAQLLEAGVRPDLPLLLVLDRDSIDVAQYKAALASLKRHGYKAFVLRELGGAQLTREQSAMVSYQLGLRAEQFVGNAASTFSALLLMERLHAGKFAAFYNGHSPETLQDFLPLHQLSDTATAHAAAKEAAYLEA